ncbi:uncharacterized protein BXZ73DRAFT_78042 [Epithele typhae]|uniref:uncharacterized protein n=1 Tax=Epithele typhae TaxID=378194 RepID=UPI0020085D87|nr:uncharacterized protein BXZ73DRAFT_78042 [Epithele typhae]KAH9929937.1 hypothetical protein BXZ73DRAFT_78042 [Epithele typhae]
MQIEPQGLAFVGKSQLKLSPYVRLHNLSAGPTCALDPSRIPSNHILGPLSVWNSKAMPSSAAQLFSPSPTCTVEQLLSRDFDSAPDPLPWKPGADLEYSLHEPDPPADIPRWVALVDHYSPTTAVTLPQRADIDALSPETLSLIHPGAPSARLPIWFAQLWDSLSEIYQMRQGYLRARAWIIRMLEAGTSTTAECEEALRRVCFLPAMDHVWRHVAPRLASSSRWLNSDALDLVVLMLNAEIRETPLKGVAFVLSSGICGYSGTKLNARFSRWIERRIFQKRATLYVPWHLQDHWITVAFDISHGIIMYADSKPSYSATLLSDAKRKMRNVSIAIDKAIGRPGRIWKFDSTSIACEEQKDDCSCGVATAFTIAHLIFPDRPPWQPEYPDQQRLSLLLQLLRRAPQTNGSHSGYNSIWEYADLAPPSSIPALPSSTFQTQTTETPTTTTGSQSAPFKGPTHSSPSTPVQLARPPPPLGNVAAPMQLQRPPSPFQGPAPPPLARPPPPLGNAVPTTPARPPLPSLRPAPTLLQRPPFPFQGPAAPPLVRPQPLARPPLPLGNAVPKTLARPPSPSSRPAQMQLQRPPSPFQGPAPPPLGNAVPAKLASPPSPFRGPAPVHLERPPAPFLGPTPVQLARPPPPVGNAALVAFEPPPSPFRGPASVHLPSPPPPLGNAVPKTLARPPSPSRRPAPMQLQRPPSPFQGPAPPPLGNAVPTKLARPLSPFSGPAPVHLERPPAPFLGPTPVQLARPPPPVGNAALVAFEPPPSPFRGSASVHLAGPPPPLGNAVPTTFARPPLPFTMPTSATLNRRPHALLRRPSPIPLDFPTEPFSTRGMQDALLELEVPPTPFRQPAVGSQQLQQGLTHAQVAEKKPDAPLSFGTVGSTLALDTSTGSTSTTLVVAVVILMFRCPILPSPTSPVLLLPVLPVLPLLSLASCLSISHVAPFAPASPTSSMSRPLYCPPHPPRPRHRRREAQPSPTTLHPVDYERGFNQQPNVQQYWHQTIGTAVVRLTGYRTPTLSRQHNDADVQHDVQPVFPDECSFRLPPTHPPPLRCLPRHPHLVRISRSAPFVTSPVSSTSLTSHSLIRVASVAHCVLARLTFAFAHLALTRFAVTRLAVTSITASPPCRARVTHIVLLVSSSPHHPHRSVVLVSPTRRCDRLCHVPLSGRRDRCNAGHALTGPSPQAGRNAFCRLLIEISKTSRDPSIFLLGEQLRVDNLDRLKSYLQRNPQSQTRRHLLPIQPPRDLRSVFYDPSARSSQTGKMRGPGPIFLVLERVDDGRSNDGAAPLYQPGREEPVTYRADNTSAPFVLPGPMKQPPPPRMRIRARQIISTWTDHGQCSAKCRIRLRNSCYRSPLVRLVEKRCKVPADSSIAHETVVTMLLHADRESVSAKLGRSRRMRREAERANAWRAKWTRTEEQTGEDELEHTGADTGDTAEEARETRVEMDGGGPRQRNEEETKRCGNACVDRERTQKALRIRGRMAKGVRGGIDEMHEDEDERGDDRAGVSLVEGVVFMRLCRMTTARAYQWIGLLYGGCSQHPLFVVNRVRHSLRRNASQGRRSSTHLPRRFVPRLLLSPMNIDGSKGRLPPGNIEQEFGAVGGYAMPRADAIGARAPVFASSHSEHPSPFHSQRRSLWMSVGAVFKRGVDSRRLSVTGGNTDLPSRLAGDLCSSGNEGRRSGSQNDVRRLEHARPRAQSDEPGVTLRGPHYCLVRLRGTSILVPAFRKKEQLTDLNPMVYAHRKYKCMCSTPLYAIISYRQATENIAASCLFQQVAGDNRAQVSTVLPSRGASLPSPTRDNNFKPEEDAKEILEDYPGVGHADAQCAAARAAGALNIPPICDSSISRSLEQVAEANDLSPLRPWPWHPDGALGLIFMDQAGAAPHIYESRIPTPRMRWHARRVGRMIGILSLEARLPTLTYRANVSLLAQSAEIAINDGMDAIIVSNHTSPYNMPGIVNSGWSPWISTGPYSGCKATQVTRRRVFFPTVAHFPRDATQTRQSTRDSVCRPFNSLARISPSCQSSPHYIRASGSPNTTRPSPHTPDSTSYSTNVTESGGPRTTETLSSSPRCAHVGLAHWRDAPPSLLSTERERVGARPSRTSPPYLDLLTSRPGRPRRRRVVPRAAHRPRRCVYRGGHPKRHAAVFHEAHVDATRFKATATASCSSKHALVHRRAAIRPRHRRSFGRIEHSRSPAHARVSTRRTTPSQLTRRTGRVFRAPPRQDNASSGATRAAASHRKLVRFSPHARVGASADRLRERPQCQDLEEPDLTRFSLFTRTTFSPLPRGRKEQEGEDLRLVSAPISYARGLACRLMDLCLSGLPAARRLKDSRSVWDLRTRELQVIPDTKTATSYTPNPIRLRSCHAGEFGDAPTSLSPPFVALHGESAERLRQRPPPLSLTHTRTRARRTLTWNAVEADVRLQIVRRHRALDRDRDAVRAARRGARGAGIAPASLPPLRAPAPSTLSPTFREPRFIEQALNEDDKKKKVREAREFDVELAAGDVAGGGVDGRPAAGVEDEARSLGGVSSSQREDCSESETISKKAF